MPLVDSFGSSGETQIINQQVNQPTQPSQAIQPINNTTNTNTHAHISIKTAQVQHNNSPTQHTYSIVESATPPSSSRTAAAPVTMMMSDIIMDDTHTPHSTPASHDDEMTSPTHHAHKSLRVDTHPLSKIGVDLAPVVTACPLTISAPDHTEQTHATATRRFVGQRSDTASTSSTTSTPTISARDSCSPVSSLSSNASSTPTRDTMPTRHTSTSASTTSSSVETSPQLGYRLLQIQVEPHPSVLSVSASSEAGSSPSADAGRDDNQKDHPVGDAMQISTPHPNPVVQPSDTTAVGGTLVTGSKKDMQMDDANEGKSKTEPTTSTRYVPIRTLQNSLFGQVQLAFDKARNVQVAIKVSHAALVKPPANENSTVPDATSTSRSQAGVSVLEDVRREARILRLLLGADQPPMTTNSIDAFTSGLSTALVEAINLPQNAVVQPGATNPLTIRQQFIDSIVKGKRSIAEFYDEIQTEAFHYLISAFIEGGDLFSVLTAQPHHKVNESIARQWMYSLCCSVRYLHAHSVAHLDLSLENICLDGKGQIRLIDFGLAAQHPKYAGDKQTRLPDGRPQRNASNHIRLLHDDVASGSTCDCLPCSMPSSVLLEEDSAIQAAIKARVPITKMKYLCRPVCEKVHKPGKLGYLAPELYRNSVWDAYKHDVFGLGVILYSFLTGRPPFTRPDESADVWFKVIYSGQWLMPQVRSQGPAAIYNTLSPTALDLIDRLLKPQHMRPSIDQIMKHPWMQASHPLNAPPARESMKPIMAATFNNKKGMQRSGSE